MMHQQNIENKPNFFLNNNALKYFLQFLIQNCWQTVRALIQSNAIFIILIRKIHTKFTWNFEHLLKCIIFWLYNSFLLNKSLILLCLSNLWSSYPCFIIKITYAKKGGMLFVVCGFVVCCFELLYSMSM